MVVSEAVKYGVSMAVGPEIDVLEASLDNKMPI